MTVPLPTNVNYGRITGRFLLAIGDGVDVGENPDGVPAGGTVTFRPSPAYVLDAAATVPSTIVPTAVVCTLDADGDLVGPSGSKGVYLVATDDEDLNPTGWTYQVTVAIGGTNTRSFAIEVPTDSEQDLTVLQPVAAANGTAIVVGPVGPEGPEGPQGPVGDVSQGELDAAVAELIPQSEKGAVSGVAPLDGSQKVPVANVPNLDAAKINTGVFDIARMPSELLTETEASATYVSQVMPEKFGAVGDGTTDDTAALQAAVDALDDAKGGRVYLSAGKIYNFTTLNVTTYRVHITGPGTLRNGTVYVGVQSGYNPLELFTKIDVANWDRTSKSTTVDAIVCANARQVEFSNITVTGYRALLSFPALALGGANEQHSSRIRVEGIRTPIWWDPSGSGTPPLDYLVYVAQNTSGGTFGVGDLTVVNCPAVTARISHVFAIGLDGLKASGNTFFFPGYQRAHPDKVRHFDLQLTDWISITGNQLFEAGYESIKIVDPRNIEITGNNIAWSGQRDLKDAILLATSTTYVRGFVGGNNISLYSGAAVNVTGTNEAGGLTIGQNNVLATNPYTQYYGVPTLPSSFSRYKSDQTLTSQPRFVDIYGSFGQATSDSQGGTTVDTALRLGQRSILLSRGKVVSVTGANTNIATASNAAGSSTLYGGMVTVAVVDGGGTHIANYVLNVVSSAAGQSITTIAANGETTGASAAAPSFTWTLNASNQLLATPVGSTSGSFTFFMTTLGNLRLA